jgi:pimeloyl-ACP methyl ester carboxylesterase
MPTAAGIYYAQFDEGHKDEPPVVLIHGAGGNHLIWPPEIRRLTGRRVLAIDLPGHGNSAGLIQQTIANYSSQMVDFLAALGMYQAVFVGYSMGGALALELAVHHSKHVAGLGLIATGAYMGVNHDFLENLANPLTVPNALNTFQNQAFGSKTSPTQISRCMQTLREVRSSVLYADWRACANFDLREEIQHIEAPAWVIAGSEDRITPVAYAHFLADRIPAARLQILAGASHMVIQEQPKAVAQGLHQFLSALSAARFASARSHATTSPHVNAMQKKDAQ